MQQLRVQDNQAHNDETSQAIKRAVTDYDQCGGMGGDTRAIATMNLEWVGHHVKRKHM